MTHLADTTLHEYLDSALDPTQRAEVDRHLTGCPQCAARLESARALFASVASLPDLPLERDLTLRVVAAIRPKSTPVGLPTLGPRVRLVLGLQVLLTLIALASVLPLVAQTLALDTWIVNLQLPAASQAAELLISGLQTLISDSQFLIINLQSLFSFKWLTTTLPAVPMVELALGLAAIGLLWLVGNGVLLRSTFRVERR